MRYVIALPGPLSSIGALVAVSPPAVRMWLTHVLYAAPMNKQ